jgi:membrane protein YdbS with pleckstrin-like domain
MADHNTELLENERIVYQTRLHWVLFLGPLMLIIIGGLSFPAKGLSALVLAGIGIAWGVISYIKFNYSYIRVTDKRVLIRVGFLVRQPYSISLSDISYVDFYQPSLGAMLNFGKITIIHGKKFKSVFRMVSSPGELVTAVRGQLSVTPKDE